MGCGRLVLLPVAISAVMALAGCGESQSTRDQRREKEASEAQRAVEAERTKLLAEVAARHKADTSWLDEKAKLRWTIELQDRLMPADGRPIAGLGYLFDLERQGGHVIAHLDARLGLGTLLQFSLKGCSMDRTAMESGGLVPYVAWGLRGYRSPDYAFAAQILRVLRPSSLSDSDSEAPAVWTAEGTCLALQALPHPAPATRSTPSRRNPMRQFFERVFGARKER